jgi:RNA polymerase-binding transcription factor DksA
MASSLAYPGSHVPELTDAELAALSADLRQELHRLTRSVSGAERNSVRTSMRIELISEALKRMRAGTYGTCLVCKARIPYARLEVIPETQSCVRCS